MGEESGSGGTSGASVRGQVGLTKKEQNVRATAQEPVRGGRVGAAPSRTRESGFASDLSRSQEGDRFVTSTEGAYRDLSDRASKGQISEDTLIGKTLIGSTLNAIGKKTATSIQDQIRAGGTAVYDTTGRIQGVVSKNSLGRDVYTGGSQYDPVGLGKKVTTGVAGRGYVMTAGDISVGERMRSGGDNDRPIGGGATDQPAKDVTGSTTQLSSAARSKSVAALGAGSGGANRRQFIG